jgi:hypothetical protein
MKAAANFKQALERRRWLAISITIVAGLLIGFGLSLWQSEPPYRKRSVSRLMADLQKQDSRLQERLRPLLRAALGDRYAPTPAINVRLNAAAELRRREPNAARPFKAFGYPWTPAIFVLASLAIVVNAFYSDPKVTGLGMGVILAGIPFYYYFQSRK